MLKKYTLYCLSILTLLLHLSTAAIAQVGPDDDGEFSPGKEFMAGDTLRGDLDLCTSDPALFDKVDYFFSVLPDDGTVTIIATFTYTGTVTEGVSPIANYSMSGTPGGGSSFGGGVLTTGTVSDTATLACVAIDTAYLQLSTNSCFSYELTYFVTPPATTADPLENDDFDTATPITAGEQQEGHLGFRWFGTGRDRADGMDYYKTVLPDDGTLRVYVDVLPSDEFNFFSLRTAVYYGDRSEIGIQQLEELDNSLSVASDTLVFPCLARDTIYIMVESASCYGYRLRYELDSPAETDDPPGNDSQQMATVVMPDSLFTGRIGNTKRRIPDRVDYFATVLPDSGRLDFVIAYRNMGTTKTTGPQVLALSASGVSLGVSTPMPTAAGAERRDTLIISGPPGEAVAVLIRADDCFAYSGVFVSPSPTTANRGYNQIRGVSVYPNPTRNGTIFFRSGESFINSRLWVTDLLGRPVMNRTLNLIAGEAVSLELIGLPAGIYLTRLLVSDGREWTGRIVVGNR